MSNIILDCDGVLLNWIDSFTNWLTDLGFIDSPDQWNPTSYDVPIQDQELARKLIRAFNQTYHVGRLSPIPGAVKAIDALHQAGCRLNIITAFSDRYEAMKLREQNLISVFGDVFNEIVSLPVGHSKKDWLSKHAKDSYFIEDVVKHLNEGEAAGLLPSRLLLIPQPYNYEPWENNPTRFKRMNWDFIQDEIVNGPY